MASVRMTGILRQEIRRNAMNAFDKANPEVEFNSAFADKIINAYQNSPVQKFWLETKEAREKILPAPDKRDNIVASTANKLVVIMGEESFTLEDLNFVALHPSQSYDGYYSDKPEINLDQVDSRLSAQVLDEYKVFKAQKETRNYQRESYRNGIYDLTSKCTTVHRMLDVEPSMETFVPQEKIQAMHVKMTRAKVAQQIEEDIEFDSSLTKQVALTSKLLGD